MGFVAPAWLLGLLLVPAIWYLHRSGPILRRHAVANLELWRHSPQAAPQAGERRRADPAWLRRAAVAALLSLALAGPFLPATTERVTVWVDDSLSMLTTEGGETRLQRGLREVEAALGDGSQRKIEVRAFGNPWRGQSGFDVASRRAIESRAGAREPRLPDPRRLDPSRSHWLVTDAADAEVNAWLAEAPVSRVFQVGSTARNLGITLLALRPQPADAHELAIQVRLLNGGRVRESRRVEIASGSTALDSAQVSLDPGASATVEFTAGSVADSVTARLIPGDALARDDTVEIGTASLAPVAVAIDPACPPSLRLALAAHPALRVVPDDAVGLAVDCGRAAPAGAGTPRVRIGAGTPATLPASPLLWDADSRDAAPPIPETLPLRTRGRLEPPGAADRVLLEAAGAPLIVLRAGPPRTVETSLDLAAPELAGDAVFPLLIGLLVDTALDESLLGRTVRAGRGEPASMVAARATLVARARPPLAIRDTGRPVELPLLLLALVLLAWDASSLGRRWLHDRVRPPRVDA